MLGGFFKDKSCIGFRFDYCILCQETRSIVITKGQKEICVSCMFDWVLGEMQNRPSTELRVKAFDELQERVRELERKLEHVVSTLNSQEQ